MYADDMTATGSEGVHQETPNVHSHGVSLSSCVCLTGAKPSMHSGCADSFFFSLWRNWFSLR